MLCIKNCIALFNLADLHAALGATQSSMQSIEDAFMARPLKQLQQPIFGVGLVERKEVYKTGGRHRY
jgi:hypothetical protein